MASAVPPEPWLRGALPGVSAVTGHLLRASEHIREDAERALTNITVTQLWATPHEMTAAGFHAKHLAGSTQRLCTYLEGGTLAAEDFAAIAHEAYGEETAVDLIAAIHTAFDRYERIVRRLPPDEFGEVREVGRQRIQTTAVSLAIHIVEHGQRHVGQLIGAVKSARRN